MKTKSASAEVFLTAFKTLPKKEQNVFLSEMLKDKQLREDFIDIALIEEAKKVKGKPVPARNFFGKQRKKKSSCL